MVGHALRLFDLMLAVLFGLWSVDVFTGITGKNRYRCYNEPNLRLAKWEKVGAYGVLGYALVRLIQYVRAMFKEEQK